MRDDPPFPLLGYLVATILTEKLATALELGDVNTRDRDWADIWHLTGAHNPDGDTLTRAAHRSAHRAYRYEHYPASEPESRAAAGVFLVWRRR